MAQINDLKSGIECGNLEWGVYYNSLNFFRWFEFDLYQTQISKMNNQVKFVSSGGKIAEKAKAFSNLKDIMVMCCYNHKGGNTISVKHKCLRYHDYKNILNQEQ